MRRREFLITSSLSAAALSVAARASVPVPNAAQTSAGNSGFTAGRSSPEAQAVVYEPRYVAACEFAREHAGRGAQVFGADGGMVQLWRGPLAEVVSRGEARIAGITSYSDFALARECARDHGLKVLHESWCRDTPVALVHWLIGS